MTKLERLLDKKPIITSSKGNSMIPLIYPGQKYELTPLPQNISIGDIVYCKVKGRFYTHIVKAIDYKKGYLIGNNKGKINGWTKHVYAKVTKIYDKQ